MNAANHFTTNLPHLKRNYEKYSGVGNCGWGSPPNYTFDFHWRFLSI
jgi:hypothetical protein